jgi:2,4-dienoyl-CoA reductase-like NADH-dependent reductase (Old Yellow Enzyme family)
MKISGFREARHGVSIGANGGLSLSPFPHLFSPVEIGGLTLKNRIFSPAHGTTLGRDGLVSEELIAYHEARARGGVGLIILEGMNLHSTYSFPSLFLDAGTDACIPGLAELAGACHAQGCKVFGQLFHAGRAVRASEDGSRQVAYSASAAPDGRYKIVPRALPPDMLREIIAAHGDAAARLEAAGLDGVEVTASMGYLVAQFLNPRSNRRDDAYGGNLENRLRFLREIVGDIRAKTGEKMVLGIRISGDEMDPDGLTSEEVLEICQALDGDGALNYFNVIAGSSAGPGGWMHVFPPMAMAPGYVAPYAAAVRAHVSKPVLVAGRINQPQVAERILEDGQADLCGLARPLICDPDFAEKARAGRAEDIRACIGCNQACVGHRLAHHPVSCIQHPESGRELTYGRPAPAGRPRKVMVVGGGPGGMKAAAVAAQRGHAVTLYEQARHLGGQALLAQQLPGRAEFGGLVTNLAREVEGAGARVVTGVEVTADLVRAEAPDALVLATGAVPRAPEIEGAGEGHVVDATAVIRGEANVGASVVVADWRCDWIGLGVAEKLARDGCRVRLAVDGPVAGERLEEIVRDQWIGVLHTLGVETTPYLRLFGVDGDTVYFQHTTSGEPVPLEGAETLVLAQAYRQVDDLAAALSGEALEVVAIGDCLSPRTAEEAVQDGLKAAWAL